MSQTQHQLSKFTAIFAGGTMISRVLGVLRDVVWAAIIPTSSRDAFIFAFRLPNMLRDIVGEGAMNAAFVPVFSEYHEKRSKEAFKDVVASCMGAMVILLLVVTALGIAFMPWLLEAMRPLARLTGGRTPSEENFQLVISLGRWTFPYLFFIGMAVFQMGVLFTLHHYSTPSWSPALLNVAILGCCGWLWWRDGFSEPAYALVLGVWLGGIAQVVAQFIAQAKYCGVKWPRFNLKHPGVRTVMVLMAPVAIGQAAGEVNKLVDVFFAFSLEPGTVTALSYANHVVQLPLSIFGFAIAAAVLPSASRSVTRKNLPEVRQTLMHGLRQCYFLIFPALLGLIILREPIIRLLYERGEFSPADTARTAVAMGYYATGLLAFAWVKVSVSGFYALQDTKTPVIIASASMILNILLILALVRPWGFRGLCIATTLSYVMNFACLYAVLCGRYGPLWDGPLFTALFRITLAGLLMAALCHGVLVRVAAAWPDDGGLLRRSLHAGAPIAVSIATYIGLCRLFSVEELSGFTRLLKRRKPETAGAR